ncbi:transmembrane 4 L6 family member 4-like [Sinocyclocheilus grahami]|uniref:Transmembrane 4 L6 family member 4-like n=1 Tax=Sinocyclocheilus grahami TaxID=75366 RepID=A0A672P789_SINGR|nr:PREDICTED: transmembrane 4 L6 family member 4-like [Sinocyclocheilus grahami]
MCSGNFAKCLGITLIPLTIICILCNILLFFPGGNVADESSNITDEVFYLGGILGSGVVMIFPALVFLGMKNNDCCGCCGNESCGKRFAMFGSILFAAAGAVGAAYSVIVSCVAINHGPKCFTSYLNGTVQAINVTYPFADGNYLSNRTLWDLCDGPGDIITWHLTLFCILLVTGLVQIGLCAFQVINGLIGTICGDCCGCCGDS